MIWYIYKAFVPLAASDLEEIGVGDVVKSNLNAEEKSGLTNAATCIPTLKPSCEYSLLPLEECAALLSRCLPGGLPQAPS